MFSSPFSPKRFVIAMCFCNIAAIALCRGIGDDEIPARLLGVGVDEKLDDSIPLDTKFVDERGTTVTFGKLLEGGKPIILSLNYSNCPGLCVAQLNGLTEGLNKVSSLKLGKDFRMVSLSIDPTETISKAASTKARYADDLESWHSVDGWNFLTGSEENIQKIAKAVGFRYTYDEKHKQYNHSAAAIFISPKGRITRYLYEVGYIRGETLKMALVEAGEGKIGSSLDAFVLWCSHYDANENRYSSSARTVLAACAGVFVTMGLMALLPFWLSGRKSKSIENRTADIQRETISHAAPS